MLSSSQHVHAPCTAHVSRRSYIATRTCTTYGARQSKELHHNTYMHHVRCTSVEGATCCVACRMCKSQTVVHVYARIDIMGTDWGLLVSNHNDNMDYSTYSSRHLDSSETRCGCMLSQFPSRNYESSRYKFPIPVERGITISNVSGID